MPLQEPADAGRSSSPQYRVHVAYVEEDESNWSSDSEPQATPDSGQKNARWNQSSVGDDVNEGYTTRLQGRMRSRPIADAAPNAPSRNGESRRTIARPRPPPASSYFDPSGQAVPYGGYNPFSPPREDPTPPPPLYQYHDPRAAYPQPIRPPHLGPSPPYPPQHMQGPYVNPYMGPQMFNPPPPPVNQEFEAERIRRELRQLKKERRAEQEEQIRQQEEDERRRAEDRKRRQRKAQIDRQKEAKIKDREAMKREIDQRVKDELDKRAPAVAMQPGIPLNNSTYSPDWSSGGFRGGPRNMTIDGSFYSGNYQPVLPDSRESHLEQMLINLVETLQRNQRYLNRPEYYNNAQPSMRLLEERGRGPYDDGILHHLMVEQQRLRYELEKLRDEQIYEDRRAESQYFLALQAPSARRGTSTRANTEPDLESRVTSSTRRSTASAPYGNRSIDMLQRKPRVASRALTDPISPDTTTWSSDTLAQEPLQSQEQGTGQNSRVTRSLRPLLTRNHGDSWKPGQRHDHNLQDPLQKPQNIEHRQTASRAVGDAGQQSEGEGSYWPSRRHLRHSNRPHVEEVDDVDETLEEISQRIPKSVHISNSQVPEPSYQRANGGGRQRRSRNTVMAAGVRVEKGGIHDDEDDDLLDGSEDEEMVGKRSRTPYRLGPESHISRSGRSSMRPSGMVKPRVPMPPTHDD